MFCVSCGAWAVREGQQPPLPPPPPPVRTSGGDALDPDGDAAGASTLPPYSPLPQDEDDAEPAISWPPQLQVQDVSPGRTGAPVSDDTRLPTRGGSGAGVRGITTSPQLPRRETPDASLHAVAAATVTTLSSKLEVLARPVAVLPGAGYPLTADSQQCVLDRFLEMPELDASPKYKLGTYDD
eukprot:SM000002S05489  [mRNA]  locus=s2:48125:48839:+ [translate_table: standard]